MKPFYRRGKFPFITRFRMFLRTMRSFAKLLSDNEIKGLAKDLPSWNLAANNASISKQFDFEDFKYTWGDMKWKIKTKLM